VSGLVEGRADFAKFRSTTPAVLSEERFRPVLETLIPRCCSLTPSVRPSFQEIFTAFRDSEFAILPGADSEHLAQSASKVLLGEKQLIPR
jgi:hypothetical protein